MQWWCSASGVPWTWTWRAYPGVWLIVLLFVLVYWWLTHRTAVATAAPTLGTVVSDSLARRILGWSGVVLVWIALDWPLGPLAAGYAASAHALQFIILALTVPPLVLFGLAPHASRVPLLESRVLRLLTNPIVAGTLFNVVAAATHVPGVVDTLMVSQLGAFAIDMGWLVAGLLFWWPIFVDTPHRAHFPPPVKVLYLFLGTLVHTVIAIIMLMAEFPLYGIYELAPPSGWFTPLTDLGIAGGIMEVCGLFIVFGIMTGIFFRWAHTQS